MKKNKKRLAWLFQLMAAAILITVGVMKIDGSPENVMMFQALDMEPGGRYLIGIIEIVAGLLLLTDALAATGAFIAIGVMLGAIIAHATVLGYAINNDGGMHLWLLIVLLACCLAVAWLRREQMPFIGKTFE